VIGTRLGSYEITAKLGEGGMGEVYRATDTKLKREVAIKVLPAAFTEDAERLARFEREAQLLAQLHHPHIASIFGLEESGGIRALVMELVEGPTLAERLEQGALPLDETLSIARQIAEALEEAHEKGIVHRDLKPQNVKVRPDGKVKVLDFGLAKAVAGGETAGGVAEADPPSRLQDSPTLTAIPGTWQGTILGTFAYMAPEQAHGRSVDLRADIWAFGVVLHEMLTGRLMFRGESDGDTLAAVLRDPIDWDALPRSTPESIRRLLERCLERDPSRRLGAIADARREIAEAESSMSLGRSRSAQRSGLPARAVTWTIAVATVAALVGLLAWRRPATEPSVSAVGERSGRSVAVLPFVNSGGDAGDDYLTDGITDELIAGLGKVPELRVAARSSAFALKGQNLEVREVARRLGVDSVLEGTVRRSGQRLRVTASLVNADDGLQLWSASFETDGGDAFAVQDEVTRGVVAGLSLQLRGADLASTQAGRTSDLEALDLYLRALALAKGGSKAELRRALALYESALARDPEFALAYKGIAWVHTFLADAYVAPSEAYQAAKAAAQAALARDERIADAHALLAYATAALDWSARGEIDRGFERALELDPNSADSLFLRAAYRCLSRRDERAFDDLARAERLDPLSPFPPLLVEVCSYVLGRNRDVIEAHRRTAAIDPNFFYIQSWIAGAYRNLGDYPAALREYERAATLQGAPQHGLGLTLVHLGRTDEARAILERMEDLAQRQYVPYWSRAVLHAALGDLDRGVERLQQAIDRRELFVQKFPWLPEADPLRADPRGRRLLEDVKAILTAP